MNLDLLANGKRCVCVSMYVFYSGQKIGIEFNWTRKYYNKHGSTLICGHAIMFALKNNNNNNNFYAIKMPIWIS